MKIFIEFQFGYYPLVWMFCGKQTTARINHMYEKSPRAVYNDKSLSLWEKINLRLCIKNL